MIVSSRLPDFTFVTAAQPAGDHEIALSNRTGRMHAVASHLRDHFPPGTPCGLMFPSGPDLVLNWLACLIAGLRPLFLHYPTKRLNRLYWAESVRATVAETGLACILADGHAIGMGLAGLVPIMDGEMLAALPDAPAAPFTLSDFTILQQSSGTTGQRKAIAFTDADLWRHANDFAASLGLTPSDCIVSWLPLYHDMGAIACFVLPLMLGIRVVMMDPASWVENPSLLFGAIARHGGTICYMPNFGYAVMTRVAAPPMPTMRHWISCSEPISAATSRAFLRHVGAAEPLFTPCYAMAENLFAISLRTGIETRLIDGVEVVSCGRPIEGVRVRAVDGQLRVRSPTSLKNYLRGGDVRDADGFYATGDLGAVIDGEVFVAGRVQDLLIQAGRKFMLSDIDLALQQLLPETRGRAAALAVPDARLGTEQLTVLIEAQDFWTRQDAPDIAAALRAATVIEHASVHFVPPRFLTKTSSGKINRRRTAQDWQAYLARRTSPAAHSFDADLRLSFPTTDRTAPVGETLDSLSLTVLRALLHEAGLAYDAGATLRDIEAALGAATPPAAAAPPSTLRIVSLADAATFRGTLRLRHINALSKRFGCPVSFEQLCLPPSPVLLSDLIFNDWFQPRFEQVHFSAIDTSCDKLRGASLIILDDRAEILVPPNQVYGALSHRCARDQQAGLLMTRWQRYAQHHDKLPITPVNGQYLHPRHRSAGQALLASYLGKPLFRIATSEAAAAWTEDWDYKDLSRTTKPAIDAEHFIASLGDFIARHFEPRLIRPFVKRTTTLSRPELGHYCAYMANRDVVDQLVESYESFCIAGQLSSLPYLRQRLEQLQKKFVQIPSFAPEMLRGVEDQYACLVICGAWGNHATRLPTIALMFADETGFVTRNIDSGKLTQSRPFIRPPMSDDWFYPFPADQTEKQNLRASVS